MSVNRTVEATLGLGVCLANSGKNVLRGCLDDDGLESGHGGDKLAPTGRQAASEGAAAACSAFR